MSDENNPQTSIPGAESENTEDKPKRTRTQRQKRFGVLIDIEDEDILDGDGIKTILKGEKSAVVVFESPSSLSAFINDECKKPSGVEISKGVFRLEDGGHFKPIVGREIQKKISFS